MKVERESERESGRVREWGGGCQLHEFDLAQDRDTGDELRTFNKVFSR